MESNNLLEHQAKIKQLFEKFLDPHFEIKNDTYLSRLLTYFSGQNKTVDSTSIDAIPLFSEWLLQAVTFWELQNATPSDNVASFTLNLASLVSTSEANFCSLNHSNVYAKLITVVRARDPLVAPSIKLGYIKLLASCLEHKEGLQWIITCNLWEDVLRLTLTNQTVYITREGHKFLSKLLDQSITQNELFCHEIIKELVSPLSKHTITSEMMEISDEVVQEALDPTLKLLSDILEHLLESVLFAQNDTRIVRIFLQDFQLEQKICDCMLIVQSKQLHFQVGKIMFLLQFLELYSGVISKTLEATTVKTLLGKLMNILNDNITKGNSENIQKFCYHGHVYWNLIGYKIPCVKVNKDNEPILFANQLVVVQLLPIILLSRKYCCKDSHEPIGDEFRDQYIQKIFKMMCETTVRIVYSWRDYLGAQPNLFEIATKALSYIMQSRKYYPRERAALVFQSLLYTLKDVVNVVKAEPERIHFFSREKAFFSLLFEAVVVFIEEFQITWRDSVETICVMAISFEFLSLQLWPPALVIKALKLVNISMMKYMSPNLALLVDRTADSTMAVLGPLLYTKLHDNTWEVRDSALEVICTISHMSNTSK